MEEIELSEVYISMSVNAAQDFDVAELLHKSLSIIENELSQREKLVDSVIMEETPQIINTQFCRLLKVAKDQKFMRPEIIFLQYCEYFNMDTAKIYNILDTSLREIISYGYCRMVGKKKYNSLHKKNAANSVIVKTVFQIAEDADSEHNECDSDCDNCKEFLTNGICPILNNEN